MLMEVFWSSLIRERFKICIDWLALYNAMGLLVGNLVDRFLLERVKIGCIHVKLFFALNVQIID
jgi:hypothetical protein